MTDKDKHDHDKDKHTPPPPPPPAPAAKEPPAGGSKGATPTESTALPPEAYMTEQEKAAIAGSESPNRSTEADKKETR